MPIYSNDLNAVQVRELLDYDPATGFLTWKTRPNDGRWNKLFAGRRAGSMGGRGYRQLSVYDKSYREHRIIWLWMTGDWPVDEIDHINGSRDDNRWENLREATRVENMQNLKLGITCGAIWDKNMKKWKAQIVFRSNTIFLGYYDSAEEAHQVYVVSKQKYQTFHPIPRIEP